MADLSGFDAEQVEPNQDFEPIPAGEYVAVAVNSEFKRTQSGNGEYLEITWEIMDGQFRGRRLWDRLNLKNPNEKAVQIAQGTLSSICRAVGVLRPRDSAELHNKPVLVKVELKERNDKPGQMTNEVKGYKPTSGTQPAPVGQAPQSAPAQQPQQASLPPWKRQSA